MRHAHNSGAQAPGPAAPELAHVDHVDLAPLGTAGAVPFHVAPNDERPTVAGSSAQGVAQAVSDHCAPEDAQRKADASMAARAAMNGCSMYGLAGGGYLLCRWGLSRACPDLRSVGALLDQIGGAA